MKTIRLLIPVAGDLAAGVPAPLPFEPVPVPDEVADVWCDGERAELVDVDDATSDVAQVHTDARAFLAAVQEQHRAEVERLHADAAAYLQAVLAERAAELAKATGAPPAAAKRPKQ